MERIPLCRKVMLPLAYAFPSLSPLLPWPGRGTPVKYTERGNLASMAAVPLFRMLGRHCRPSLLSAYLRACRPAHLPSHRPAFLSSSELRAWTSTCLSITCLLMPSHLQKTPACQQQLALLPRSHLTIPANLSSLIPHYLNFPTMFTRLPDSRPHSQPIRLNPPGEKKETA